MDNTFEEVSSWNCLFPQLHGRVGTFFFVENFSLPIYSFNSRKSKLKSFVFSNSLTGSVTVLANPLKKKTHTRRVSDSSYRIRRSQKYSRASWSLFCVSLSSYERKRYYAVSKQSLPSYENRAFGVRDSSQYSFIYNTLSSNNNVTCESLASRTTTASVWNPDFLRAPQINYSCVDLIYFRFLGSEKNNCATSRLCCNEQFTLRPVRNQRLHRASMSANFHDRTHRCDRHLLFLLNNCESGFKILCNCIC